MHNTAQYSVAILKIAISQLRGSTIVFDGTGTATPDGTSSSKLSESTTVYKDINASNISSQSVNNSVYLGNTFSAGNFREEAF